MDVNIRIISKSCMKRYKLGSNYPCFAKIQGKHNHSAESAEALGQLRVDHRTRDAFQIFLNKELYMFLHVY